MTGSLAPYFNMADGFELPNTFANRATWALYALKVNPDDARADADGLIWCPNHEDNHWYSIAGNYSAYSPAEKFVKAAKWEAEQENQVMQADQYYEDVLYQSKIRQAVLDRDGGACQICGKVKTTRLHVHHILKRSECGTDHFDNLLTVCSSCHRSADTKLYNPPWTNPRDGIV